VPRAAVADLINRATVVVVPSRRESFGLVAVEAALLERPVVAARVGGLPEIVVHDETGLLVEPDDSAALADAMAFLLDNPPMARRMGARARTRAQRLFAVGSQSDAYVELYERIRH
jgi:glycosyltransferase involved in cell wall biosynthesis